MGTRLLLKVLYTMLAVLAILAGTLLILMVAFEVVNTSMNPPWEQRNVSPAEEPSLRGSRPSDESSKGKRLPAGEMIGFLAPDSGIYVLGLANGVKSMVLGGVPLSAEPDWSTDGRKIAFVGSDGSIWVMKADGTDRQRLKSGGAGTYSPDWSPDGEKLAFSSYSGGGNPGLQIMDVTDSERKTITDGTGGVGNFHPSWSPDGERIVFMKQGGSPEAAQVIPVNEIHVTDADGSNQNRLSRGAGDDRPAFSPDGTKIAFVSRRDGNLGIYVMNADGTNVEKLAGGAADNTTPSWSPDGERLVFGSEGAVGAEIRVVNEDGTGERSVTDPPTEGIDPSWLP